ncbi:MAG TPA: WcbI family polysaccharide biosynthesis putative acetyltransferase [Acetobacteraceae bacterium]|nr:WcbI family polysaccharide biosynthesis putative acetyltransferase [Acetobacteraceae bacterium]
MKQRTVAFVGNCQLGTLASLYRRILPPEDAPEVVYLPSYEAASDAQMRVVAEADIVVHQVLDFAPRIGELAASGTVHLVPHLTAFFLWPCTGHPHPSNQPHPYSDASGPYNTELGDSFLNRMLLDGVDPDEAVNRFMSTDIAAVRRADRMREIALDKQRSRDRACGYAFADFIEANFQTQYLFRSPNHPEIPLSIFLATEVFSRLGLHSKILDDLQANPPRDLFPATQTPIHPSVIACFGLTCVTPDTRYRYFDEGFFNCSEYAGRYMRYEWNPLFGEAYEQRRSGQKDAALATLRRAVERSPRSAAGHAVIGDLLAEKGLFAEAAQFARKALELDPENAHYKRRVEQIASQLAKAG